MQIVLASPPGRMRENLLTMLETIESSQPTTAVDSCNEAFKILDTKNPAIILVDYRHPDKEIDFEIGSLIMNSAVEHIVLLKPHNSQKSHFTHFSTSELVYDDITIGTLINLFKNINVASFS